MTPSVLFLIRLLNLHWVSGYIQWKNFWSLVTQVPSSLFFGGENTIFCWKISSQQKKNLLFAIVSSQLFLHESADERTTIFSQCWQTSPLENIISVSVSVIDCLHNKLSWISHFIFLLISDFQIKSRWSFLYSIKSWCSFLVDECFWRQTSA